MAVPCTTTTATNPIMTTEHLYLWMSSLCRDGAWMTKEHTNAKKLQCANHVASKATVHVNVDSVRATASSNRNTMIPTKTIKKMY